MSGATRDEAKEAWLSLGCSFLLEYRDGQFGFDAGVCV